MTYKERRQRDWQLGRRYERLTKIDVKEMGLATAIAANETIEESRLIGAIDEQLKEMVERRIAVLKIRGYPIIGLPVKHCMCSNDTIFKALKMVAGNNPGSDEVEIVTEALIIENEYVLGAKEDCYILYRKAV